MWYHVIIKLSLALIIGGAIGYEREHLSRPAGLRTNAIVCIGATLIQIVSINFQETYYGQCAFDPFRLGAQVISGIGFLGAGTIIKEGISVKGLTTAASIWTVACMGLAIGSGLYYESIVAAIFLMVALKGLKVVENYLLKNKKTMVLDIIAANMTEKVSEISYVLEQRTINILNVSVDYSDEELLKIEFLLEYTKGIPMPEVLAEISKITGIKDAKFKSAIGY